MHIAGSLLLLLLWHVSPFLEDPPGLRPELAVGIHVHPAAAVQVRVAHLPRPALPLLLLPPGGLAVSVDVDVSGLCVALESRAGLRVEVVGAASAAAGVGGTVDRGGNWKRGSIF